MSSRDHIPEWVNILLGDSTGEEVRTHHSEPSELARSSSREATRPEAETAELSARILGRANSEEWRWRWQTMLRPLPEEVSR